MHVRKNSLRDNWDDEHGYYSKLYQSFLFISLSTFQLLLYNSRFFAFFTEYHLGEVLDGHYRITAGSGKGVFSTVVQAKDLKARKNDPEEVAIKIICNDDTKER